MRLLAWWCCCSRADTTPTVATAKPQQIIDGGRLGCIGDSCWALAGICDSTRGCSLTATATTTTTTTNTTTTTLIPVPIAARIRCGVAMHGTRVVTIMQITAWA